MQLGPKARKVMLGAIALFFALMLGWRFYPMVSTSPRGGISASVELVEKARRGKTFEAKVRWAADGDTVVLEDDTEVRYLGVDAPEKGEPYYEKATALNRSLVEGKKVRLDPCRSRPTDKYGRLLAFVYYCGENVSLRILREGQAVVYDDAECNGKLGPKLWETMIEAYRARRGLWSETTGRPVDPKDAKGRIGETRLVRGKITSVGKGKKNYYAHFGPHWRTTSLSIRFPFDQLKRLQTDGIKPEKLNGKTVTVIGEIQKWNYGPFITCYAPSQIIEFE